jgi:hypothetical protein
MQNIVALINLQIYFYFENLIASILRRLTHQVSVVTIPLCNAVNVHHIRSYRYIKTLPDEYNLPCCFLPALLQ